MKILGLNHGELNSSAALVDDGTVRFAAPEERFNRQKKTKAYPFRAVEYCLSGAGIDLTELDAVAQGWNPAAHMAKYNPLLDAGGPARREGYLYTVPDNLLRHGGRRDRGEWTRSEFDPALGLPPVYYVQHHRCHAALSFFSSPFEEAAFLTHDWRGELECMAMGTGAGNRLETLQVQHLPHSLGMLYGTFTELLGYRPHSDEWKVMALSAFDLDAGAETDKLRSTYRLTDDGGFEIDQSYYKGALLDQPRLYTPKLVELLGGREGEPGEDADEWHIRVAIAMQTIAEDIALHTIRHVHARTGARDLVLGGGFFMNSVLNGKIEALTPFENVFIPFAPADVGNSIGSALYVNHCALDRPRTIMPSTSYLGPAYDDDRITATLARRCIPYSRLDAPAETVARLLADGEIVAHFDGRMEFGERALGNRSILADPRSPDVKDRINAIIKYRESYRPFAPSVLAERVADYFAVEPSFTAHFMEKVVPVRAEHRDALPAITHVDGSGRVQTVTREMNARYHAIIREFDVLTGVPLVLNTSFNINGEPVVNSPDDALNTFYNSGLTHLVLGSALVRK